MCVDMERRDGMTNREAAVRMGDEECGDVRQRGRKDRKRSDSERVTAGEESRGVERYGG